MFALLLKNLYTELGVRELANRINPFISFAVLHTEIYLHMPLLSRLHIFSQSELSILFTSNVNVRLRDILYILPKQDFLDKSTAVLSADVFIYIFRDFFPTSLEGRVLHKHRYNAVLEHVLFYFCDFSTYNFIGTFCRFFEGYFAILTQTYFCPFDHLL